MDEFPLQIKLNIKNFIKKVKRKFVYAFCNENQFLVRDHLIHNIIDFFLFLQLKINSIINFSKIKSRGAREHLFHICHFSSHILAHISIFCDEYQRVNLLQQDFNGVRCQLPHWRRCRPWRNVLSLPGHTPHASHCPISLPLCSV